MTDEEEKMTADVGVKADNRTDALRLACAALAARNDDVLVLTGQLRASREMLAASQEECKRLCAEWTDEVADLKTHYANQKGDLITARADLAKAREEIEALKKHADSMWDEAWFVLRGGDNPHDVCSGCGCAGYGMLRDALRAYRMPVAP